MNTTVILTVFIVGSIYVLEPNLFRFFPELTVLAWKYARLEYTRFFLKRKLRRELNLSLHRMKQEAEGFTKDDGSV